MTSTLAARFEDAVAAAAWARPVITDRPRRVLAHVLAEDGSSGCVLQRAEAVACALGAELFVLRSTEPTSWRRRAVAGPGPLDGALEHESVRAFAQGMLGRPIPADRVMVRSGHSLPVVLETAAELDVELIVVAGDGGSLGCTLTREAPCAVLIARAPTSSRAIVAATDFSDERYPALSRASELAIRLRAEVTFVHNVATTPGLSVSSVFGIAPPLFVSTHAIAMRGQLERLRRLASGLESRTRSEVLSRSRPADAILEVARRGDADLVVVGKRPRPWFARVTRSTAEIVAREARRSVLAVPLDRARGSSDA